MIRLMNLLLEAIYGEKGRPSRLKTSLKQLYSMHDRIKDSVFAEKFPTRYA